MRLVNLFGIRTQMRDCRVSEEPVDECNTRTTVSEQINTVDSSCSRTKALVLHSGGLDSSVCLLLARQQGREVISLGIEFGQRHRIEMQYAAQLCKKLGIPRRKIRVRWDRPAPVIPRDRTVEDIRQSVSPAFLPGRNAVFLALAAAESAVVGAKEIWIGVNSIDYSGYPDCRAEFIEAFQAMLDEAIPNGPEVIAPLQNLSKPQIARLAIQLGLSREETWSCYTPERVGRRLRPCGRCDACVLSAYAWTNAESAKLAPSNVCGRKSRSRSLAYDGVTRR